MAEREIFTDDVYNLDTIDSIDGRPDKLLSVDLLVPNGQSSPILRFSYEQEIGTKIVGKKAKFLWIKAETTICNDKAEFYKSFVYQGEIYYLYRVK